MTELYLSTSELARMSGLSQRTILRRCRSGEIPHTKFPGKILILASDARAWLENHKKSGDIHDIDDIHATSHAKKTVQRV